jgi:peptide/nickel transport system permease protein
MQLEDSPGAVATPASPARRGAVRSLVLGLRQPVVVAVARRLLLSIPLLFVVSAFTFVLMNLIPGDATYKILGPPTVTHLPLSRYHDLAHELGLDQPLFTQYWSWLSAALHGDLGHSLTSGQGITEEIGQRLPVTVSLVVGSVLVSTVFGVLLGVLSAVRGGPTGTAVDTIAMVGWIMPAFWIAAELVAIFAVKLSWFPAIGYVPLTQSPGEWLRSIVLPVVALSLGAVGFVAQYTREAMLDALSSEFVRAARASGISQLSIVFRHALKTASLQVVTLAGLLTVGLLVGTVFVEQVFTMPGLGALFLTAIAGKDIPVVEGVAVFFTLIIVAVNLATDLAYSLLSPRVGAQ